MYQAARRTSTDQNFAVFYVLSVLRRVIKKESRQPHVAHADRFTTTKQPNKTQQPINPTTQQQINNNTTQQSTTTRHNNQQRNEQQPHHNRNNATTTTGQQQHDRRTTQQPHHNNRSTKTTAQHQTLSILDDSSPTLTPSSNYLANQHDFRTSQHAVKHEAPDYEKFRPYFGWVNVDTVQKTMQQSTQWGVSLPNTFPMKRHLKSRNPALNVPRRHEAVATDTVFSDTPAVDSGVKQAQVFVGRDTLVADAYPMKSGKQFVNTLEDNIRRRGAMDKLLSDSAKTEISNKVMDILRAYHISNWHSEPYHQNQNPAEWRYRTIKSWTNTVMNRSGAPANCWLLCLIYVCYLLNRIACTALDGKIPLLALTGITPDISIILLFTFYQPVFYATYDQHFPSESEERAGYWVGFGEHCGDAMTHKILDQDTQKIIYRSAVRPKKSSTPNHRLAPHGGEVSTSSDPSEDKNSSGSPTGAPEGSSPEQKAPTVFIRSRDEENPSGSKPMPTFGP